MISPRVTKALNPQRRRKLSAKQIRAGFGGKRRKASLRGKRHTHHAKRRNASPAKPKRRVTAKARNTVKTKVITKYRTRNVYVEKPKRKAKAKRRNPGPYLLTMAPALNPQRKKRRNTVAKTKRKVSAKRSGVKKNPTRRRVGWGKKSQHGGQRRSNPFGHGYVDLAKRGLGVIIGVSGCKLIPRNYPTTWTATPSMSILSTGVTAGLLAWAAGRFIRGPIADGILLGGVAQTLNVALNAFAPPSILQYATLGDFTPGGFPLPQGPVRYALSSSPMEAPNGSQVNVGAFGRAW